LVYGLIWWRFWINRNIIAITQVLVVDVLSTSFSLLLLYYYWVRWLIGSDCWT
jgi:hypothetical protein